MPLVPTGSYKIPRNCIECGRTFYIKPSEVAKATRIHCSMSCATRRQMRLHPVDMNRERTEKQKAHVAKLHANQKRYPDDGYGRGSRLLEAWRNMKSRCYVKSTPNYNNYGGRGIKICDEWKSNYLNFKAWSLNNGYDSTLTIDRINTDGDYSPDNCRWVTMKVQQNNKRVNKYITAFEETKTMAQWVEDKRCCVSYGGLKSRLISGINPELAITRPPFLLAFYAAKERG